MRDPSEELLWATGLELEARADGIRDELLGMLVRAATWAGAGSGGGGGGGGGNGEGGYGEDEDDDKGKTVALPSSSVRKMMMPSVRMMMSTACLSRRSRWCIATKRASPHAQTIGCSAMWAAATVQMASPGCAAECRRPRSGVRRRRSARHARRNELVLRRSQRRWHSQHDAVASGDATDAIVRVVVIRTVVLCRGGAGVSETDDSGTGQRNGNDLFSE